MSNQLPQARTRAQAIADGALFDLSHLLAAKMAWKIPMACTAAVWGIIDDAVKNHDYSLPDIIYEISVRILRESDQQPCLNVLYVELSLVGRTHTIKAHSGPGDGSEPVLTLMLPDERVGR
jgi:hypothetical protein